MTAASTLAPAALDALIVVLDAAFNPDPSLGGQIPGQGAQVVDAVLRSGQTDGCFVAVEGWVTTLRDPATFGAPNFFTIEEQFEVTGTIWLYTGASLVSVARGQAAVVFAAMESAVRTDPTLGGAVRVAWFSHHAGSQGPDAEGGSAIQITWALHCEGRIQ